MRRSSVVDFAKHRQLVFAVNRFHQPTQPTFISGTHPGVSVDVISLVQQRQYALHKLNVHRRRVTVSLCVTVTAFLIYIYCWLGVIIITIVEQETVYRRCNQSVRVRLHVRVRVRDRARARESVRARCE